MKKLYFILIAIVFTGALNAQQITLDNQYILNKYSLSPAYAGYTQNIEAFVSYRNDWVGVEGAPEKRMISINASPYKNMGVGGVVSRERVGIFTNLSTLLSYAYEVDISTTQKVRFGLSAGIFDTQIDFSHNPQEQIDPIIVKNQLQRGTALDVRLGIIYQYKDLNVGVHIPRIYESNIKNEIDDDNTLYTLKRHFIVHASYKLELNPEFDFEPLVLVNKTQNSPLHYNVSALVKYKKAVWAGIIYRKKSTLGANLGAMYNNFALNYSYEFSGQGILGQSSGSHEITIGYFFGKTKDEEAGSVKKPYYNWFD